MVIRDGVFRHDMPIDLLTVEEVKELGRGDRLVKVMDDVGCYAEFHLRYSPELGEALNEARRSLYDCPHQRTAIRTKLASNGRQMVMHQCQDCGGKVGDYLKKDLWPEQHVFWDEGIERAFREKIIRAQDPVLLKFIEQQQEEDQRYSAYLLTPKWRRKRQMVLDRDKHICQGCLIAPATEVHHLTYRDIYNEFLFQLVSLCGPCHERYHSEPEAE